MGCHSLESKGQMYEYDNHLPLAIRWGKGIKNPGRTIDDYVNFIDFAPTILEQADVKFHESGMAGNYWKKFKRIF